MLKILVLSALLLSPIVSAKTLPATHFKSTQNFIQKMVKEHQFDKNELLFIFSKIKLTIAKKGGKNKTKPPKKKTMTWDKYKSLFITDERIADGLQFWQDNLTTLNRAESTYNVPTRSTSKPKQNAQYWRNKGLNIDSNIHNKTKLAFIRLPQKKIDDTWLTFWNFYVLTRYNHDNRYAMAAYQLSTKIRQQFNRNNH